MIQPLATGLAMAGFATEKVASQEAVYPLARRMGEPVNQIAKASDPAGIIRANCADAMAWPAAKSADSAATAAGNLTIYPVAAKGFHAISTVLRGSQPPVRE